MKITFEDLSQQRYLYHVVSIIDLEKTLNEGISFDDKKTYTTKYYDFHFFFDKFRPSHIPAWVERRKAIFASLYFKENHGWHSHTAVLRVKIKPDRCWVCNENIANFIYEPFILRHLNGFDAADEYIKKNGRKIVEEYWNTSISYLEHMERRYDKKEGYDAEVLILHDIPPEDIDCLYIVSDHEVMSVEDWKNAFNVNNTCLAFQSSRYLQPRRTYSAWNTSGSQ